MRERGKETGNPLGLETCFKLVCVCVCVRERERETETETETERDRETERQRGLSLGGTVAGTIRRQLT